MCIHNYSPRGISVCSGYLCCIQPTLPWPQPHRQCRPVFGRGPVRPPVGWATLKRMVREFLYFIDFTVVSLWTAPTTHWRPNNHNKPVRDVNNYLANEGRLYKTANPFGLSRQAMLKIARQVCVVITVHLGPVYIVTCHRVLGRRTCCFGMLLTVPGNVFYIFTWAKIFFKTVLPFFLKLEKTRFYKISVFVWVGVAFWLWQLYICCRCAHHSTLPAQLGSVITVLCTKTWVFSPLHIKSQIPHLDFIVPLGNSFSQHQSPFRVHPCKKYNEKKHDKNKNTRLHTKKDEQARLQCGLFNEAFLNFYGFSSLTVNTISCSRSSSHPVCLPLTPKTTLFFDTFIINLKYKKKIFQLSDLMCNRYWNSGGYWTSDSDPGFHSV